MEYYVYMTNDCNLMCEYCSVLFDCEKNSVPLKPRYQIEELLDFMKKMQVQYNDEEIRVFFFGGEPSMEYELIGFYMKTITQCFGSVPKFVLHTNGLLLGDMPEDVLRGLDLIILSFNYEKIPKHHLAESYYSKVIGSVLKLREKSAVPITARITVTEQTSLYVQKKLVEEFCQHIYFQIANCDVADDFSSFYQTYTFEVDLLYRSWLEKLKGGQLEQIIPFMAVLKFLFYHDRDDNVFGCGYDRHQIYVQTDGRCYACCDSVEAGIHNIGKLADGIRFSGVRLTDYCCGSCKYRRLCLGRCGRMHREFSAARINEYCRLNQYMFDLFLRDKEILAALVEQYPYYKAQLCDWTFDIMELTP